MRVSRDEVTRSAGVKSILAAPLSGTGELTQWGFQRRGHCHPNTRQKAGCTDMGRKKRPEFRRNGTIGMDKPGMEVERSQVTKQR